MIERKSILTKLAVVAVFVVAYFGMWRPIREYTTQKLLSPQVQRLSSPDSIVQPYTDGKTTLILVRTDIKVLPVEQNATSLSSRSGKNVVTFNGFGNVFFLLGSVVILLIGPGLKPVGWLFLLHQGITLLSLFCLFLAVSTHPAWLYPMNLLVTYITPAATGMYVLTWRRGRT